MVRIVDLAVAAGIVASANGHGQMMVPVPRPDPQGRIESYKQREPVSQLAGPVFGYSADGGFRCRDTATPSATIAAYTAGQTVELSIKHEANHPGDCSAWISYDCQGITGDCNPVNFFKVAAFPGCGAGTGVSPPNQFTLSFTLPAELPACDHCVLRWEWIALQQVVNIEAYVQCSDVSIASGAGPTKPTPLVAINGISHLPSDINAYRKVYSGGTATYENQVGPAVATYSTCAAGSANCLSSSGSGPIDPPAPTPPTPTPPTPTPPTPTPPTPTPPTPTPPTPTPPTDPAPEPCTGTNKLWAKCGGKGFTGATCCPSGARCNRQDEWYSQCVPSAQAADLGGVEPVGGTNMAMIGGIAGAGGLAALMVGAVVYRRRNAAAAVQQEQQQNVVGLPDL